MAWRRSGDKPLSEPMMVSLLTHICVTRPQWVNPGFVFAKCLKPVSWCSDFPFTQDLNDIQQMHCVWNISILEYMSLHIICDPLISLMITPVNNLQLSRWWWISLSPKVVTSGLFSKKYKSTYAKIWSHWITTTTPPHYSESIYIWCNNNFGMH